MRYRSPAIRALLLMLFVMPRGAIADLSIQEFPVPKGSHPHDVAPAADGGVWYTAQKRAALGYLDVKTGRTREIALGKGSAPHGVIVGADGTPWITDGGLNAIVHVDPTTDRIETFPLPHGTPWANLNTATFGDGGILWFTGQSGIFGRLDTGIVDSAKQVRIFNAPGGAGPYGICTLADGSIYYASLAGSHIARIDTKNNKAEMLYPPTPAQGARRLWADSKKRIWVSEWYSGKLARYDSKTKQWNEWTLPGTNPQPYAVYIDDEDQVWLSDFGANALVRFDPTTEKFTVLKLTSEDAAVRQLLGRPGEVWGAESGVDKLVVVRTR